MRITWYGHAAFAIEGTTLPGHPCKVILDPYNYPECGGYLPIDEAADVVCVSHDNPRYHSDLSTIRGEPVVLKGLEILEGPREAAGVTVRAFRVFEDEQGNGENAMVRFGLEGIEIAHQGDLGHPLTGRALDFLRGTDVLLALAGGPPTLELSALRSIVEATTPALVIPMHFGTPKVNLNLLPVERFLDVFRDFPVRRPGASTVELTREELPDRPTILVLDHAR